LFKHFEVSDKDGNDISSRFTPLLKELFLLLLLYSQKENKGISTGLLKDILWFDKEQQSAYNNRAVNIGKLKGILDSVGKYSIISNPYIIKIEFDDDVYCDYTRIFSLLYNESLNKEQIMELISIVRRGAFLPECNYEWLDPFKAEISDRLIDNLLNLAKFPNIKDDNKLLIQIADTLFNLDSLNENALIIKCTALTNSGKRSIANITYNHFVKNYENSYNKTCPISFLDIINSS
jgi:two-component SAPR family response regulator